MPLPIIATVLSTNLVSSHITHILAGSLSVILLRTYCQGRKTNRERDLHGRVILVTGGFTSTGLILLDSLARRGAHIIALTPQPIDDPATTLLVDALRISTSNEHIFAEQCDMASPASVRAFCQKFLTNEDTRLDALVFGHEYAVIGSAFGKNRDGGAEEDWRKAMSLSTFLMVTLLLPPLLVAPAERDIRIVTAVNPFYAAAIPTFPRLVSEFGSSLKADASTQTKPLSSSRSTFHLEGTRALRTAVLTRHLQRVLDALPAAPAVDPEAGETVSRKKQKSNIVAVCVSPGVNRTEVLAPLMRASTTFGWITYIFLLPILFVLTKSPLSSIQTILHALFLPTPFKRVRPQKSLNSSAISTRSGNVKVPSPLLDDDDAPEEVLKPGALYTECCVVRLNLPKPAPANSDDPKAGTDEKAKDEKGKGKGKGKEKDAVTLDDDGEMGGEALGRMVWEMYEAELKVWEKSEGVEAGAADSKEATDLEKETIALVKANSRT